MAEEQINSSERTPAATDEGSKTTPAKPDLQALAAKTAQLTSVKEGEARQEFSAATIARMMGVATVSDLTVIETKIDLLMTKIVALNTRLEKVVSTLNNAPTGSDFERIDVQLGSLKSLIRDALGNSAQSAHEVKKLGDEVGTKEKMQAFLNKKPDAPEAGAE